MRRSPPTPAAPNGGKPWRRTCGRRSTLSRPELILVSAGFDAHKADPLAQMELDEADFAWAAKQMRRLALRHCKGKLVSTLEGGYDLPALARSAASYLGALQRD